MKMMMWVWMNLIICLIAFGLNLTVVGNYFLVLFDVKLNSVVFMNLKGIRRY